MSYYVESNLTKDEKVIKKAKINFLAILPQLIFVAIFLCLSFGWLYFFDQILAHDGLRLESVSLDIKISAYLIFGIFLLIVLVPILSIMEILSLEVAVTNKRIIGKKGLFTTKAINIPINQISSTNISLGFFGKIFNYATVEISSTGMKIIKGNTQAMKLMAISNSYEFLNSINKAIDDNTEQQRKLQAEELAKAMNKNIQ